MTDPSSKNHIKAVDVIVIGSGVGGGTVADYLTRDNSELSVVILEAGPYFDRSYFNQREIDMTSLYINRGSILSKNLEIAVAAARAVGGSSTVYTGVSFRPPKSVLEDWQKNFGLDFLNDNYVNDSLDEIEKDISVHELPKSWDNQNNQLFTHAAEKLGIEVKRLKINVKGCRQQGFCNLGCTAGAKQGTLEVQIPRVIKRGVQLIANAYVTKLEENKVHVKIKDAPKGSIKNSYPSGDYELSAKVIVVAAGTLNTPALLLRSKKSLGLSNKNIGRYLTLHPALNVNAVYKEVISNYTGFPKTVYIDQFSKSDDFYLETSFYYPGITAKNIPGSGLDHSDIMKEYNKMMSILILIHDNAEFKNRIAIDKNGNSVIHYELNKKAKTSMIKAIRMAVKLFFAAGCTRTIIPGSKKDQLLEDDLVNIDDLIIEKYLDLSKTPLSSAHPQGGVRMGTNPDSAVCDTSGRVYGTKSIFVSDASLFPTSVHVNPYETIMLFAKHIAEEIKKEFA